MVQFPGAAGRPRRARRTPAGESVTSGTESAHQTSIALTRFCHVCVAQEGLGSLRRVLQAFVLDQPEVGYTQSMNYLAVRATQQLAPSLAWPRRDQRGARRAAHRAPAP